MAEFNGMLYPANRFASETNRFIAERKGFVSEVRASAYFP